MQRIAGGPRRDWEIARSLAPGGKRGEAARPIESEGGRGNEDLVRSPDSPLVLPGRQTEGGKG